MAAAHAKALSSCRDAEFAGKVCDTFKTTIKIEKARDKFRGVVVKACGGRDKFCEPGGQDDVPLQDVGWNIGTCGGTGSTVCLDPILDCNDVASCVDCIQTHAIDDAFAVFYDPAFADPGTDARLRDCLRTIGHSGAGSLIKVAKGFGRCWLEVSKRNAGGSFSCPDRKASGAVGGATKAVCKECGGGRCGGPDDISVATIGFPAQCASIGTCAGPVQTVRDVAGCIDCVNAALMDAATRRTIPAFSLSSPPVCVP